MSRKKSANTEDVTVEALDVTDTVEEGTDDRLSTDKAIQPVLQQHEALTEPTARILETFQLQVPMPGHLSATCVIRFEQGQLLTDKYVIDYLRTTSKAPLVEFID